MKNQGGAIPKLGVALLFLLAVIVIASVYIGKRPGKDTLVKHPENIENYLFWEAKNLTEFKFTGADGKTLGLNELKGKWSFIFFGYTQCPDVCPLTMGILGKAFSLVEKNPAAFQEIQGIFISVDPKRDTPELLKEYASYFGNKFIGVTGDTAQLDAFSRQLSVFYTLHSKDANKSGEAKEPAKNEQSKDAAKLKEGDAGESYAVTHSSTVFLVDPQGRLYGRFPPPHLPQEIAEAFMKIRMYYNTTRSQ